jgi:hypothetical protein
VLQKLKTNRSSDVTLDEPRSSVSIVQFTVSIRFAFAERGASKLKYPRIGKRSAKDETRRLSRRELSPEAVNNNLKKEKLESSCRGQLLRINAMIHASDVSLS